MRRVVNLALERSNFLSPSLVRKLVVKNGENEVKKIHWLKT